MLVAGAAQKAVGDRLGALRIKGLSEVAHVLRARPLGKHIVLHRAIHHIQQNWGRLDQPLDVFWVPEIPQTSYDSGYNLQLYLLPMGQTCSLQCCSIFCQAPRCNSMQTQHRPTPSPFPSPSFSVSMKLVYHQAYMTSEAPASSAAHTCRAQWAWVRGAGSAPVGDIVLQKVDGWGVAPTIGGAIERGAAGGSPVVIPSEGSLRVKAPAFDAARDVCLLHPHRVNQVDVHAPARPNTTLTPISNRQN